jgi:hypothetical protein
MRHKASIRGGKSMEDTLTLTLPRGASAPLIDEIQSEVSGMDGVEQSGELGTRGLDVVTIGVWVKLVSDSAGLNDKAVEIVRKFFTIVRNKDIKGAKVTVGATIIELGEMGPEDFENALNRLRSVTR